MKKVLCLIICIVLCVVALTGCGGKTAKVLVSSDFADSLLLSQLTSAFSEETGYKVKLVIKDNDEVEKAVSKGDFDAALCITTSAAEKLQSGEWIGGGVFFNTMYLIGPKNDPASVRHLGQYAIADVLKHITLTGFSFVHPSLITPLGLRDVAMWLKVDATQNEAQRIFAADSAEQLVQTANNQGAYAIVTRQNWAQYGASATNATVLLSGIPGLMDQYTVLAKQIEKKPDASQAFCQWMLGQKARSIIASYTENDSLVPAFESNIPVQ